LGNKYGDRDRKERTTVIAAIAGGLAGNIIENQFQEYRRGKGNHYEKDARRAQQSGAWRSRSQSRDRRRRSR